MSSILKKRKCSFKPTESVRVALAELEYLIDMLGLNITLEQIINVSLQKQLPLFLLTFKKALANKENLIIQNVLKKMESILQTDSINLLLTLQNIDEQLNNKPVKSRIIEDIDNDEDEEFEDTDNMEEDEDIEEKIFDDSSVDSDILNRLL